MANGYLQSALTQLTAAETDLQSFMQSMHNDTEQQKNRLRQDIQRHDQERKLHEAELHNSDQSDMQRRALEQHIHRLNQQCDEKRAEMQRLDQELQTTTMRKTQVLQQLHGLTQQLNQLMAHPDL